MKINVQAVNFNAQDTLLTFLNKKVSKLEQYYDKIINANIFLKLENSGNKENKTTEIVLEVPGDELVAKKTSITFEESIDSACEAVKKMIIKRKEKI
ncbi:putative sigma-54 modulation protein [Apibacter mensalis]|uniref:Putative sigma-54 modulation protein n=1 Tax=Apibacter mensalis TaxID=1586267 RepID=A0A0X3AP02_9FLAO|nr:ribosome-associated translation inhibitor RaiA [Apibacter mensalis]CVK16081.1 putative sigma-54 modulation protein [Apibacter mensalis]